MAGLNGNIDQQAGPENVASGPSKTPDQLRGEALKSIGRAAESCGADPASVAKLRAEVAAWESRAVAADVAADAVE